jgi:hypothetical protein
MEKIDTTNIVQFDCFGTIVKVNRKIILQSDVNSILRDMLENSQSNMNETIQINDSPEVFRYILSCHKYNIIEHMPNIPDRMWCQIESYYGLEIKEKECQYNQNNYIKYFLQLYIKDDSIMLNNIIIYDDSFTLETFNRFGLNKYIPIFDRDYIIFNYIIINPSISNQLYYTTSVDTQYNNDLLSFDYYDMNKINEDIDDTFAIFSIDSIKELLYKQRYTLSKQQVEQFKTYFNTYKAKNPTFKEDKELEEAFYAQFDYKKNEDLFE